MDMLTTALLGVASSIATEIVVWLNSKFLKTPLEGDGALVLSLVLAFSAAFVRLLIVGVPLHDVWDWATFMSVTAAMFGWSQFYFKFVAKVVGLTVQ